MIQHAYRAAVAQLRLHPHYVIPVPTAYELAAHYRRIVPGARLADIREEAQRLGLVLADTDAAPARTA